MAQFREEKNWLFTVDSFIIKLKKGAIYLAKGGYHGGDESARVIF
jgi:hypothetical protein